VNDTLTSWVSFIGFLFGGYCGAVGAYVVLRWGYCGVHFLWTIRKELDTLAEGRLFDATSDRYIRGQIREIDRNNVRGA